MPNVYPPEEYGAHTPEANDYYERLTEGLALTLDEELVHLNAFRNERNSLLPNYETTRRVRAETERELKEASAELAKIKKAPAPRRGLAACRAKASDLFTLLGNTANLERQLDARIGSLQRQVDLRQGVERPRNSWQQGKKAAGSAKFGVYAFYDYDGHALYVGKTVEGVSTRVRRHLSNQRTDAVAMSVLDPLEVVEVEIWPVLWAEPTRKDESPSLAYVEAMKEARDYVNGLEYAVEQDCLSRGWRVFNEKKIDAVDEPPVLPASIRFELLSDEYRRRLGHPDLRITRRVATSARLASRISERTLKTTGLRRSLQRQLGRLSELTSQRFTELGGEDAVESDDGTED